jgi:hypothetical protein
MCHPRLGAELHDFGRSCPCQLTAEQRQEAFRAWFDSPEAEALRAEFADAERQLEEELQVAAADLGVDDVELRP